MATSKSKDKPAAGPANRGLEVTAKRASFMRGGQQFGFTTRIVALAELSPEQAEQIRAEGEPGGMLIVREVDMPDAPADETKT